MNLLHFVHLLSLAGLTLAIPTDRALEPRKEYPYELVYDLGPGIAPENQYLRSNGQLLVTCLTCGTIRQIDPNAGPDQVAREVYTFPLPTSGVIDVLGIDELEEDVFVVAVGEADFSALLGGGSDIPQIKGPTGLYIVDLREYQAPTYNSSLVKVRDVGGPNTAGLFDGVAIVNAKKGLVAATDFMEGAIWLVNIYKNISTVIAGPTSIPPIGPSGDKTQSLTLANGLKYRDGNLYFTASTTGTFGILPINPKTGVASKPIVEYNYGFSLDDLGIAPSGNIYFTTFAKPDGGVLKRAAGTPQNKNGTQMIASEFATNSVIPVQRGKNCELLLTVFLQFQVGKVVVPGKC